MIFPSSAESTGPLCPSSQNLKEKIYEFGLICICLNTLGFAFCNDVLQLVQSVFINPMMLNILIVNQTNAAYILKK